ncbi:hypothetical protein CNR37_00064 [Pseudomonas phage ventosus]|uniref:DNA binding protein n=1 Tax=Pseudomonas phage ventosus TaxID=2048980 RepID=A0A2H4P7Y7_9CAUD|nr:hypothetical protein CNR37_00064 [Pseudomonas phage ventosus]
MIARRRLDEFVNDADYVTRRSERDGGRGSKQRLVWVCPYYKRWCGMKERAGGDRLLKVSPTYADVSCCDDWLLFSNFKAWMVTQPWNFEKSGLDKDLRIPGSKIYSPDTCRFIPPYINNLVIEKPYARGSYPLGACFDSQSGRFKGQVRSRGNLTTRLFDNVKEAHGFFQVTKARDIRTEVLNWKSHISFDQKIADNLLAVSERLLYDNLLGRETISYFPLVERT